MKDFEIIKRIAELDLSTDLLELYHDEHDGICVKKLHSGSVVSELYNPLEDDSLAFQLMIKYDVIREWEPYDFIGWNYHCLGAESPIRTCEIVCFKTGIEENTPNKAICLAIIQANEGEEQNG